jgi:hypothetical protein
MNANDFFVLLSVYMKSGELRKSLSMNGSSQWDRSQASQGEYEHGFGLPMAEYFTLTWFDR